MLTSLTPYTLIERVPVSPKTRDTDLRSWVQELVILFEGHSGIGIYKGLSIK